VHSSERKPGKPGRSVHRERIEGNLPLSSEGGDAANDPGLARASQPDERLRGRKGIVGCF